MMLEAPPDMELREPAAQFMQRDGRGCSISEGVAGAFRLRVARLDDWTRSAPC
jgi:hypothetical protein